VLDVGCGDGYNTQKIAEKAERVLGIDNDQARIDKAKKSYALKNVTYLFGDVTTFSLNQSFDKVVLSNVLEHIEKRHEFLLSLHDLTTTLLIRVPLLTRDWLPVYLKNKKIDYRLDPTHQTEYTEEDFKSELLAAKWNIKKISIQFGEIWAVVG
jgi:SAM-dependent methyltransferase